MGLPPGERRRAYGLVVVATLAYTCLMFIWFSLPAYLSVIIEDVGLTGTQAGVLVGAVPFTYIPLALFTGLLVDRFGPGRSLAAGVAIYGIGQIARSFAADFWLLLACTLLIGVGATAITFGLPKLVSMLFPADRTGFPSSIYLIGASAGSATVFAVGRPVLGPLLGGWRGLFFWSGVAALVYAIVWFAVARRAALDAATEGTSGSRFDLESIDEDLRTVLAHPELRLVVVIGTMYLFLTHSMQGWLPTILEARGLSADFAGRTTSLLVVVLAVGTLVVPAIADRLAVRRTAFIACGAVVSVGIVGIVTGTVGPVLFLGVVVTGIGIGGISPLIRAVPTELDKIGSRLTGTAIGFIFAVGEIGGFLGPVLVGALHEQTGSFLPGLGLLAAGGLVVAIAGELLRRADE